ncbi:MAG: N-6 DNA methylase [Acidobacteriota bacterium]|nr:N-6 DNA methylase [Acidobacteriota bacterium]
MPRLNLKATHAPVKKYYETLHQLGQFSISHEGAVADAFADLLKFCGKQFKWTFVPQYSIERKGKNPIRVDAALLDLSKLRRGVWEAKDEADDLDKEIKKKLDAGYPTNNIIFQEPKRAVLLQRGKVRREFDLEEPQELVDLLTAFFEFEEPEISEWQDAVDEFSERIPEIAGSLKKIIDDQKLKNHSFIEAFAAFVEVCRVAINPNISEEAVERMLIQHLLTERIFRRIFNNPDFSKRNVIAAEIEKVIAALTSKSFSRDEFLAQLDHFYNAIEKAAQHTADWQERQRFLNTVYERFFQGYSAREADTLGIVYTPQEIVEFMVRSVEEILEKEFDRSLSAENVHVLDPFVGTGSFMVRVMKEIKTTALEQKYKNELWCNEIMLLPYYIASMNIEHEYFERTGKYEPFEGICLVDTFELAESSQGGLGFMNAENTARVARQKHAPIKVIVGNPPYNVGQANENDNNKNRPHPTLDRRVSESYSRSSKATSLAKLNDAYIRAFRWASDRLGSEGVVAFVTNSSYLDKFAFDGVRKHLCEEFDDIYIVDLGGDVRKNPKLSGTTHNVFGIQVGVCIGIFVRRRVRSELGRVHYFATGLDWRREQKLEQLRQLGSLRTTPLAELHPDQRFSWLTEGLLSDFDAGVPLGSKDASQSATFRTYGLGLSTNRDAWAYNFKASVVGENIEKSVEFYNSEVRRWVRLGRPKDVDEFVKYNDESISWSRDLKRDLQRERYAEFSQSKIRRSTYRPFTSKFVFADRVFNEEIYQQLTFFPEDTVANQVICVPSAGARTPFWTYASCSIPNLALVSVDAAQCFPFYTFDQEVVARENITDWALNEFRSRYRDKTITKWDIFHYIYAVLHHPAYRERYAANLKREIPRVPYAPKESFGALVKAGKRLMEIHANYEDQPEYKKLKETEKAGAKLDWRVERMKLSKDKTTLIYNEFLTLGDIPPAVYEYRLGNRSALEWIVDQYQVSTDKRSGIVNDPNREDDPKYTYKLIKKVVAVSVETVEIVKGLPDLGLPKDKAEAASTVQ